MKISKRGVDFIASYEGFVPFVYDDKVAPYREWKGEPVRGTLTIGYGHTNAAAHPLKCSLGTRITKQQALDILAVDLSAVENEVNQVVDVPLTQGQYDALVSFTYNCGGGNLRRIATTLNKGDYEGTTKRMLQYITSKGQVMAGLVRRRKDEVAMFKSKDVASTPDLTKIATPKTTDIKPKQDHKLSSLAIASASVGAFLTAKPVQALIIVMCVAVVVGTVSWIVHKINTRKVDAYVPKD